jgi:CMP-N-acetylneuraminic acid synthetase|tara:strand:- start:17620 stop:18282 length:663 start_codon:yes stop_codon:yes gene_type:complete
VKSINITALVPMRHSSSRIKGKNYKLLNKKPLFEYILGTLLKTKIFDKIVINTDSPIIKKKSLRYKNIIIHNRPRNLKSGFISMNKIIEYDCKKLDTDFIFQTHSTNPLLTVSTIKKAVQIFVKKKLDCLFAVTKYQNRLWDKKIKAINHNPKKLIRTQDLIPLYEENSCFYIFKRNGFLKNKNRIFGKKMFFEISPEEGVDIDNHHNWNYAKFLLNNVK